MSDTDIKKDDEKLIDFNDLFLDDVEAKNSDNTSTKSATAPASEEETKVATEALYKQNLELAILNKNLSLLRKLYQVSVLALDPLVLAQRISEQIRTDLDLEIAGILEFEEKVDTLTPLYYAKSEKLSGVMNELGFLLKDVSITNVKNNPFFKETVYAHVSKETGDVSEIWGSLIPSDKITLLKEKSNLKTILLYPLTIETKVIGALLVGLNREYETLNDHEKESIKSLIDVVSVALDKAYLYKELQDANESLKSLDKLKTEFLGLASHQLRAPLTSIKGYASMILEESYGKIANDGQKTAVDRIFQSSQNLARVIEDLLDVSKIEQGGMKFEMSAVDMRKMAQDVAKEFEVTAKNKGLTLSFEEKELSTYVAKADPVKIRQVIMNLTDNSIKYTKEGFIKIILSKPTIGTIRIAITDSGMGISAENISKLFEKFSRAEGGKVNAGGSGLGLYLAKEIVIAHGGKVWAESPGEGKGASFIIELPEIATPPKQHS